MQFVDAAPIAGTRRTADGYLVADVRTARTGIQTYAGYEVGRPVMQVVRVYRSADQVFDKASLGSYAHKPVTNDHPAEAVTASNWKDVAVGQIGDEVARDGEFVRIPLVVMDAAAIQAVTDGKQELSAGYTCDLEWKSGRTPEGEEYDAIQKDIRINHVAIVQNGRAGSQARIGDGAKWGASPVTLDQTEKEKIMTLKTVTVDGIPVEVTDQGATVITTLQTRLSDAATKLSDAEKAHLAAIAAKDADLAKKDAELDALKAKVLSDADIDKRVQDRADLITKALSIAKDVKTEGLSDAAIRKAVVVAKLGDAAIKDKAEAYIDVRFDILADEAAKNPNNDPVRTALLGRDTNTNVNDNGQTAYEKRLSDAWKTPAKGA